MGVTCIPKKGSICGFVAFSGPFILELRKGLQEPSAWARFLEPREQLSGTETHTSSSHEGWSIHAPTLGIAHGTMQDYIRPDGGLP